MFLWLLLILLVLVGSAFTLLLKTYRKQNAIEESFLCSILLMAAGCIVPESLLLFPAVWWAFTVLWSDGLRVYLASVCGILLVAFYAVLVWKFLPGSTLTLFVEERLTNAFQRQLIYKFTNLPRLCRSYEALPNKEIYKLSIAASAAVLGLWALIAHLARYTRANVRIQNFLLVTLPFFALSALSVVFPAADGNCMLSTLAASALFLVGLYIHAYGFPRIRLPKRRRDMSRRRIRGRKNPYRM